MDYKKVMSELKLDNLDIIIKGKQQYSDLKSKNSKIWKETKEKLISSNDFTRSRNESTIIHPKTKKVFIMTIILLLLSIILISFGIITYINNPTTSHIISCLFLGTLLLIPGAYYLYQFYLIKKTKNKHERKKIIDSLPKL